MSDILGIEKAMRASLEKTELPDTLNTNIDEMGKSFLTFGSAKNRIADLEQHMAVSKGLPYYLGNAGAIAVNFCKHVIPCLESYIDAMSSGVKTSNCDDYVGALNGALDNIIEQCNNASVQKINKTNYKKVLDKLNVHFGATSSNLIGDYAAKLKESVSKTKSEISRIMRDGSKSDEDKLLNLFDALKIGKQSSTKKLLRKLLPHRLARRASIAASSIGSQIVSGVKKKLATIMIKESLDPVEYYNFEGENYLNISLVHIIHRILDSYVTALKSYPKAVSYYVGSCKPFIKNFLAKLGDYESYYKVLINSKKSKSSKIKAKENMRKVLKAMQDDLVTGTENNNNSLFVYCKDTVGASRSTEPDKDRSVWFPEKKGDDRFVKNVDGNDVVIKGWSLGDFLCAILPVFKFSNENFEKLLREDKRIEIGLGENQTKSSSNGSGSYAKKFISEITKMLEKSISLYKDVKKSYDKVESLSLSSSKKTATESKYKTFAGKYENIKKISKEEIENYTKKVVAKKQHGFVETTLNASDVKDGCVLINDNNSVNKSSFTLLSDYLSIFKLNDEAQNSFWSTISDYCGALYEDILNLGQSFVAECESLAKITSKKSKSKVIVKDTSLEKDSPVAVSAEPREDIQETKERIERVFGSYKEIDEKFSAVAKSIDEKGVETYVRQIDKMSGGNEWEIHNKVYNECGDKLKSVKKLVEKLQNVKIFTDEKSTAPLMSGDSVNEEALNSLGLPKNNKNKSTVIKHLDDIDGHVKQINEKIAELKKWVDNTLEAIENAKKVPKDPTPQGKDTPGKASAPNVPQDSLKNDIEESLRNYKELLTRTAVLKQYQDEFGFGKARSPESEKIMKKKVKDGEQTWKEAKDAYKECDKYVDRARDGFKGLVKIKVLEQNPSDKKAKKIFLLDGAEVAKGIVCDKIDSTVKDEIGAIIRDLKADVTAFNTKFGALGKMIEEMKKEVELAKKAPQS